MYVTILSKETIHSDSLSDVGKVFPTQSGYYRIEAGLRKSGARMKKCAIKKYYEYKEIEDHD